MSLKTEVKEILALIKNANTKEKMPDNAIFLNDSMVLNYPREDGDSRYPLDVDGYTLWTYASGFIHAREGRFYTLGWRQEGDEPVVGFFAGLPLENGKYEQVSLLGIPKKAVDSAERYTVFTPYATYYFTLYKGFTFCVRAFINKNKEAVFSVYGRNDSQENTDILLSSYINPLIMCERNKDYDFRWVKKGEILKSPVNNLDTAIFRTGLNGIVFNAMEETPKEYYRTSARCDYCGGKSRNIGESLAVYNGYFKGNYAKTFGIDDSVYGDIRIVNINSGEEIRSDMVYICLADDITEEILGKKIDALQIDADCEAVRQEKEKIDSRLNIKFGEATDGYLDNGIFNNFISFVKRQAYFSGFTKVYGWSEELGMRDIWQHSEPTLYYAKKDFEKMAINALSVVEDNGRVPRQYGPPVLSYPISFDLNKKPDQGMWAIDTMYTYLCVTNNWDFLNETCPFYSYPNNDKTKAFISEEAETVLEHICRMLEYLISIIAEDTGCVRVLVGDWNDALLGLGASIDNPKEFGSGVSIMASLQVYRNLAEVIEILEKIDSKLHRERIQRYKKVKEELLASILKYAIVENENGEKRIVHGWGDKQSFYVGSFCDGDGKSRISAIDHSFWLITNMIDNTPELYEMIVNNLRKTDSKYGIRTFDEPFTPEFKQLKNITGMLPGTLENACTYIHNAMFGTYALFKRGDYSFAFEQMKKLLPFTHESVSHSAFVMSNAYMDNEEYSINGVAVNDWQTGSAPVLLKIIINQICGFQPSLDGLYIAPCGEIPFKDFSFKLNNERFNLTIKYIKSANKRKFIVNGKEYPTSFDSHLKVDKIFISNDELEKYGDIEVVVEG